MAHPQAARNAAPEGRSRQRPGTRSSGAPTDHAVAALHDSTSSKNSLGWHSAVEQALFLQRMIGNRAALRLLEKRTSGLTVKGSGADHGQKASRADIMARETLRGAPRDFSRIPLFAPERADRPLSPSPFTAPLVAAGIQTKLVIGRVDDPLEHEANRLADQVMRMPQPARANPSHASGGAMQRKCAACAEEDQAIARKGTTGGAQQDGAVAPAIVHEVLASPSQSLNADTRAFFEPRFGSDFSQVRVHTEARAAESARAVGALAYTVGRHVVFGYGQYQPNSANGQFLLAHELTHVLQQTGGNAKPVTVRRSHVNAGTGRKVFDCPDFIGDTKLEACLNDEDRLRPFEQGDSVIRVQKALLRNGANLGPQGADGKYGAATGTAVMTFKTKYGLGFEQYPDVGPGTMAKLDELCPTPTPTPQPTPHGTICFDTIDWPAYFAQESPGCESLQLSISLACQAAPGILNFLPVDPTECARATSKPVEQRIEDCIVDRGFYMLAETCGIPTRPPGAADIRQRYREWLKKEPTPVQNRGADLQLQQTPARTDAAPLMPLVQRQTDDEGHQTPYGRSDSSNGPSGSIDISDNLFVAIGQDETGGTQLMGARYGSLGLTLQRQPDIPPPSPFPSVTDWYWDIHDDAISLYGMTCKDGAERGFYVMWNQHTGKSFAGNTAMGVPATGCNPAEISLGPIPRDAKPVFPVGWFHTHPMANPGCRKLTVGPSGKDEDTSRSSGLPGMVEDTQTTSSPCAESAAYFFGPTIRNP